MRASVTWAKGERRRAKRNTNAVRSDFHLIPDALCGIPPDGQWPLMMLTLTPVGRSFRAIYLLSGGHLLRLFGPRLRHTSEKYFPRISYFFLSLSLSL